MTKAKYATADERREAVSRSARAQMLRQQEERRKELGQDAPGYYGCHRRVRTRRGRAGDQLCVECGQQAKDWAYIHGTDPAEVMNYRPMCRKCHFVYDGVGAKIVAAKGPDGCRRVAEKAWVTKRRNRDALASGMGGPDQP